ncbi:MAG TPA: hypothetical protein VH518_11695 [Tepidisphaeraceae bacterium]|jgi:hypothetical protein
MSLFLLTASLWVMSYASRPWLLSYKDHVTEPSYRTNAWCVDIDSWKGRFQLDVYPEPERWADYDSDRRPNNIVVLECNWPFYGRFHVYSYGGRRYLTVWGSYWPIAVATALLPALWIPGLMRRLRASRRRRLGCCAHCGYDLRATPDRCPECGAVAANRDWQKV